ncbi:uncharacterized protein ASCRUDRAFT_74698 [Ascoidea rubescens DSM 1968]|uniref:Uncharacterized protein n=1 Tax=Ascoidea rubescens DSM 1968 TaxID=1344418 RepID=A0A1D2VL04_9ASCO|nr:hypothetical protein ASCRUDRAFT_74698 [Ascoidea rubescens DSM 1968]ODV62278.1 hypothetical protein ASCRUDRAFT_74698 [Ascoidea rubescens DSM 1968]
MNTYNQHFHKFRLQDTASQNYDQLDNSNLSSSLSNSFETGSSNDNASDDIIDTTLIQNYLATNINNIGISNIDDKLAAIANRNTTLGSTTAISQLPPTSKSTYQDDIFDNSNTTKSFPNLPNKNLEILNTLPDNPNTFDSFNYKLSNKIRPTYDQLTSKFKISKESSFFFNSSNNTPTNSKISNTQIRNINNINHIQKRKNSSKPYKNYVLSFSINEKVMDPEKASNVTKFRPTKLIDMTLLDDSAHVPYTPTNLSQNNVINRSNFENPFKLCTLCSNVIKPDVIDDNKNSNNNNNNNNNNNKIDDLSKFNYNSRICLLCKSNFNNHVVQNDFSLDCKYKLNDSFYYKFKINGSLLLNDFSFFLDLLSKNSLSDTNLFIQVVFIDLNVINGFRDINSSNNSSDNIFNNIHNYPYNNNDNPDNHSNNDSSDDSIDSSKVVFNYIRKDLREKINQKSKLNWVVRTSFKSNSNIYTVKFNCSQDKKLIRSSRGKGKRVHLKDFSSYHDCNSSLHIKIVSDNGLVTLCYKHHSHY